MMDKEELKLESKKSMMEGRAVMIGVVTATVFLCIFTLFEIFVIKMEWNIPVMKAFIEGSDKYLFVYYREEEEQLESSTENEQKQKGYEQRQPELVEEDNVEKETLSELDDTEHDYTESILESEIMESTQLAQTGENTEISVIVQSGTEVEEVTENEVEQKESFPYYLKINRQQNVITVYEIDDNDEYTIPVKAILCSTGLYNATPKGVFHLSSKYIWRELHGGVYGQYASRITGGVLFHSVPYASKNKSTLYWEKYNKLGEQASMGCVRLTVEDAKWIYDNCPSGTAVEIYDSEAPGPLGKPETLKLDKDNVNKGWDPTDPDEKNPWHEWSEDD